MSQLDDFREQLRLAKGDDSVRQKAAASERAHALTHPAKDGEKEKRTSAAGTIHPGPHQHFPVPKSLRPPGLLQFLVAAECWAELSFLQRFAGCLAGRGAGGR